MNLALILLKTEPAHPLFDAVRFSIITSFNELFSNPGLISFRLLRLFRSEALHLRVPGNQ